MNKKKSILNANLKKFRESKLSQSDVDWQLSQGRRIMFCLWILVGSIVAILIAVYVFNGPEAFEGNAYERWKIDNSTHKPEAKSFDEIVRQYEQSQIGRNESVSNKTEKTSEDL